MDFLLSILPPPRDLIADVLTNMISIALLSIVALLAFIAKRRKMYLHSVERYFHRSWTVYFAILFQIGDICRRIIEFAGPGQVRQAGNGGSLKISRVISKTIEPGEEHEEVVARLSMVLSKLTGYMDAFSVTILTISGKTSQYKTLWGMKKTVAAVFPTDSHIPVHGI